MFNITQNPVNNNNSDFFNAKLPLPPNEDTCENRSQDKSLGGRMNKFLKENGFGNFADNFQNIKNRILQMSRNSSNYIGNISNSIKEIYKCHKSGLHVSSEDIITRVADSDLISVDIGGTHVKVALVKKGKTVKDAEFLFDLDNKDFKRDIKDDEKIVEVFMDELAKKILGYTKDKDVSLSKFAIIWSNPVVSKEFIDGDYKSITGIVSGISEGLYEKSEWYCKTKLKEGEKGVPLKDGDDLGEMFRETFRKRGILVKRLIIGNDTVFTQKALPGAVAGAVLSTGGNAGCAYADGEICNLECGGVIKVFSDELSKPDKLIHEYQENGELDLQHLCTGYWFSPIFEQYVLAASDNEVAECSNLAKQIRAFAENKDKLKDEERTFVKNKYISYAAKNSDLLLDDDEFSKLTSVGSEEVNFFKNYTKEEREAFVILSKNLIDRAARAGAGIIYSSIADKLDNFFFRNQNFTIALDSSMCVYMFEYYSKLRNYLNELIDGRLTNDDFSNGKNVKIVLLSDKDYKLTADKRITVPTVGGLYSLIDF